MELDTSVLRISKHHLAYSDSRGVQPRSQFFWMSFPSRAWSRSLIKCVQIRRLLGEDRWQQLSITEAGREDRLGGKHHLHSQPGGAEENARNMIWQGRGMWNPDGSRGNNHIGISEVLQDSISVPDVLNLLLHFSLTPFQDLKYAFLPKRDVHFTGMKAAP